MSTVEQTSILADYVELEHRRRQLEEELKSVKQRQGDLVEPLAEWMGANGMQSINKDGLTVYLKTQRWVKKTDEDSLAAALRLSDWDYLVRETINTNSLRSALLEALDNGVEVGQAIMDCIEITERTVPAVRAS